MDVQSLQPKNGRDENNSKNSGNGITFRQLFAKDINKTINGVIKASDEKNTYLRMRCVAISFVSLICTTIR